ncbi:hypothetical protein EBS40_06835 [bacterium]|nr:hypothetical protein [bacterium]
MKQTKKKPTYKHSRNKLKVIGLASLAIISIFHILVTAYLFTEVYIIRKDTDPLVIRSMVFSSVDAVRKPAPVNFATGDSYVPEAKIYMPRTETSSSALYSYSAASTFDNGDVKDEEVTITSSSVMSSAKVKGMTTQGVAAFLESIPQLQACSRAFFIKFVDTKPQFAETTFLAKVPLQDGRTAYIH